MSTKTSDRKGDLVRAIIRAKKRRKALGMGIRFHRVKGFSSFVASFIFDWRLNLKVPFSRSKHAKLSHRAITHEDLQEAFLVNWIGSAYAVLKTSPKDNIVRSKFKQIFKPFCLQLNRHPVPRYISCIKSLRENTNSPSVSNVQRHFLLNAWVGFCGCWPSPFR